MLLIMLGILCGDVFAGTGPVPYYRFWRGWKVEQLNSSPLSYQGFKEGINSVFIPATVRYGQGRGMLGYLPSLPFSVSELEAAKGKGVDFPDEIALVVYGSEEGYNRLRVTPEGKAYGDLHRLYFDMPAAPAAARSRSLVPLPWTGTVAVERAYDLFSSDASWMKPMASGFSQIVFHEREAEQDEASYLAKIKSTLDSIKANASSFGLESEVVLVADRYWIEYQLLYKKGSSPTPRGLDEKVIHCNPFALDNSMPSKSLEFGRAVNVQF